MGVDMRYDILLYTFIKISKIIKIKEKECKVIVIMMEILNVSLHLNCFF